MRRPHQAAISANCCAAPATSPVWPPIARRASATIANAPAPLASAAARACANPSETRPSTSATTRAEPHAAASAPGSSRPAAAPAPSARAGAKKRERRQRAGARERGDGDQAQRGAPKTAVERRGQRADAQDEGERQRDGAIGADAAVAHDVELRRPRRAAAEAVGDVGEPVLVQGAGRGDERGRRQAGANERGQAEEPGQRQRQRADKTDRDARDRRRPGEAIDVERRARAGARRRACG